MNKLEAFKKMSAAFFKAETNEAVKSAAADVQNTENIADALESFADALDLQNTSIYPTENQGTGDPSD